MPKTSFQFNLNSEVCQDPTLAVLWPKSVVPTTIIEINDLSFLIIYL